MHSPPHGPATSSTTAPPARRPEITAVNAWLEHNQLGYCGRGTQVPHADASSYALAADCQLYTLRVTTAPSLCPAPRVYLIPSIVKALPFFAFLRKPALSRQPSPLISLCYKALLIGATLWLVTVTTTLINRSCLQPAQIKLHTLCPTPTALAFSRWPARSHRLPPSRHR
jgi:hypothetical protein